jgi:hypothetical protein
VAPVPAVVPVVPVVPAVAPIVPAVPAVAPVAPVADLQVGVTAAPAEADEVTKLRQQVAQQNVYMAAGTKEEFDAMSEWAKTGLDEGTKNVLNDSLKNGTPEIQAYLVKSVMEKFNAAKVASTTVVPAVNLVVGDTTPIINTAVTSAMTSAEYSSEYKRLRGEGKDPNGPEILAIDQRRNAGILQGK